MMLTVKTVLVLLSAVFSDGFVWEKTKTKGISPQSSKLDFKLYLGISIVVQWTFY